MPLDKQRKIFHESWYRLAGSRIALRSSVRIHRQIYRGVLWYVLYEPFTNQYFRLPQGAYSFVSRLSVSRTVGEIWNSMLESGEGDIPGQGEVIEMLAQLYQANMLLYDGVEDGTKLFDRDKKKTRKKVKSTLLNIFFLRIPVFDPDPLLNRLRWLIRILLSTPMMLVWLATVIVAVKYGVENFDALKDQSAGFLAPSNIGWVYVCTVFVKLFHEFGHASVVKKYGGEVHTLGVMFMLLAPLPYVDATASWSFRKKRHRAFVGAAGMLFEFFIASVALILWANLGGGTARALCYNVFIICSVSTVLFNVNPLMRFDGYYILTDLLDMPNLQQHSVRHLQYLLERYAFRKRDAEPVAFRAGEKLIYTVYGISSAVYRFFLFAGFIVAISAHYLILSFVMGVLLCLTMVVIPVGKFFRYVFWGPGLSQVRNRAAVLTVAFFALLFAALFYLPVPDTFTAPGVLEARHYENTIANEGGFATRLYRESYSAVRKGDTLVLLENLEIKYAAEAKRSEIQEARQMYYRALNEAPEDMHPLEKRLSVLKQELEELERSEKELALVAGMDGIWSAPGIEDYQGRWVGKGDSLGILLDTTAFDFLAVVNQEDGARLFTDKPVRASVRLHGDVFKELKVVSAMAIPSAQDRLPSNALGWLGGGEVETKSDGYSEQTAEPVYLVRAEMPDSMDVRRLHGRTGKIRIQLGYAPLAVQGIRKVRQALQKYYKM
ncbi:MULTISPECIES: hypothetical protein [unclassified Fibrobacter]|uniref:hypothetical protein n=1 Tax=unclassified Fibrobacter TaxID=2634177 RepID=UPI0025B9F8AC|nr:MULTISPECIES: hypothetical protein [unclassified Fibrobacter]